MLKYNMNYAKLLISPIAGSIIGYFTNWLAIKMLFKPHKEIRLLGIKLPFTPGLIPKEKERLAKSVGVTIGRHLLSEEVLVKALLDKKVLNGINRTISDIYIHICNEDNSLDDILKYIFEDNKGKNIELIEDKLTSFILDYCSREDNLNTIVKFILVQIQDKLDINIEDINLDHFINTDFINSDYFKQWIIGQIIDYRNMVITNELSISKILPNTVIDGGKNFINSQVPEWMPIAINYIDQPFIQEKIKEILLEVIKNNLGKFALIFVDADKIYDKVSNYLKEYIQKEENQKEILIQIDTFINQILEKPISQWIDKVEFINDENEMKKIYDKIINYFTEEEKMNSLREKIKDYISNHKDTNLLKIIKRFKPNIIEDIEKWIKAYLKDLLQNEDFNQLIKNTVKKELNRVFSLSICKWIQEMGNSVEEKIKEFVLKLYKKFVVKQFPLLIKKLDIPNIVENRIIEFEMDYAEEIILTVVDRELKAITWLGAVLGFIIGLIPSLLSL